MLQVISEVAPYVCVVKTHIDTLPDFDITVARQLKDLSEEYNFIIMEDRYLSILQCIISNLCIQKIW